jgi:hypothetical protein
MNPLGSRNIIIIDDNYIGEYSQAYMEVGKQIDDMILTRQLTVIVPSRLLPTNHILLMD